ncbi:hypothetical protein [Microbacterium testaceum]|uniref:hypothetical protein n=1 Tax=Microbacterium testaceum TaxID=2033 RepID=UPI002AC486AF|nr:hypothetical protein [Microbacterium testaceum]MDZ5144695.1 hypothetical protein [Microbacterium testaceum]
MTADARWIPLPTAVARDALVDQPDQARVSRGTPTSRPLTPVRSERHRLTQ